ncbi:uncharacterized protein LOC117595420 isoform X2 [Esox lucius]|nr:uncharacterized protein LOC117595420 isoform X2 [Esox lucius]
MAPPATAASPSFLNRDTPHSRQGSTRQPHGRGDGHSRRSLLRFSVMLMTVRRMATSHTRLVRRLLPFLSSMCSSLERIAVAAEGYATVSAPSSDTNAPSVGPSSSRSASPTQATASSVPSNTANSPRPLAVTPTSHFRSRTRAGGGRRFYVRNRINRRLGLSRIFESHLSRRGSFRERAR